MSPRKSPKVLMFDVFGTVVDWRTSVVRELKLFGDCHGVNRNWDSFADQWRGLYQPSMEAVRSGKRDWVNLDTLHLESLTVLLDQHQIEINEEEVLNLNRAWHRLDPWPDSVSGLNRLKSKVTITTLSNGNVALLVNMAKRAALPWDAILCAETARCYKPMPEAYLNNIALLDHHPSEVMMVAAHNSDLAAAQTLGMQTAFVVRPKEHGENQDLDLHATGDWDIVANSFNSLADHLDC